MKIEDRFRAYEKNFFLKRRFNTIFKVRTLLKDISLEYIYNKIARFCSAELKKNDSKNQIGALTVSMLNWINSTVHGDYRKFEGLCKLEN